MKETPAFSKSASTVLFIFPRRSVSAIRVGYRCMSSTWLINIKLHWECLRIRLDKISLRFYEETTDSSILHHVSFVPLNLIFLLYLSTQNVPELFTSCLKLSLWSGMQQDYPLQVSIIEQIEKYNLHRSNQLQ